MTVIYLGQGSCTGVDAILSGTPMTGTGLSYWDTTGAELTCDITGASGVAAHIGISEVFATTCYQLPGGLPASVADYTGPVQAMTFAAHSLSEFTRARSTNGACAANAYTTVTPVTASVISASAYARSGLRIWLRLTNTLPSASPAMKLDAVMLAAQTPVPSARPAR